VFEVLSIAIGFPVISLFKYENATRLIKSLLQLLKKIKKEFIYNFVHFYNKLKI